MLRPESRRTGRYTASGNSQGSRSGVSRWASRATGVPAVLTMIIGAAGLYVLAMVMKYDAAWMLFILIMVPGTPVSLLGCDVFRSRSQGHASQARYLQS